MKPSDFHELIPGNDKWHKGIIDKDSDFFKRSAQDQHPNVGFVKKLSVDRVLI